MGECAAEQFSSQFVKAKQTNKFFSFFPVPQFTDTHYSALLEECFGSDERILQIKISLGRDYRLKLCIKSWDTNLEIILPLTYIFFESVRHKAVHEEDN